MGHRANTKRCGLDIGGTQIKGVVLDESLKIIAEYTVPSKANLGPEAVKEALLELIQRIQKQGHQLKSIGIGCAGSVDSKNGIVRNSPNFAHWSNVNLKEWVEKQFNLSVKVDNDANCATLAEWSLGKGRGKTNLLLLTLGTGIGGGLILNNQLYRGSTGTGGELGHFSINSNGIPCPCGNFGCFERYCSASALKAKLPHLSAKEIFENYSTDPDCKIAIDEFLHHLKIGLTSLANIFDPDIILLGGAVSQGLIPHIQEIRDWVKKSAFPAIGVQMKIDFTDYQNNSGAIGAALLGVEK